MKRINTIGIILIFLLQSNIILSQVSFEVEGNYVLSAEKLVTTEKEGIYERALFHSFGINARKIFESQIFIKGGVYLKRIGTKFYDERAVPMQVGVTESYEVVLSAKGIAIPVSVGFYFFNDGKLRLGAAIGFSYNILTSQALNSKELPSFIETYSNYMYNFNTNLEIGYKLTNYITLSIIPFWQQQMNSNNNQYKQRAWGGEFGISYGF